LTNCDMINTVLNAGNRVVRQMSQETYMIVGERNNKYTNK
jgi:hypothetical protein